MEVSSTSGQRKGAVPVPPSRPFPAPYADDFDAYPVDAEARLCKTFSRNWRRFRLPLSVR